MGPLDGRGERPPCRHWRALELRDGAQRLLFAGARRVSESG
jgi:hypothetical protein